MHKIPVFFHIPRSGGTYLSNQIRGFFRLYLARFCKTNPVVFTESRDSRYIFYKDQKIIAKMISVVRKSETVLTVFCLDRYSQNDQEYEKWEERTFLDRVQELDLFAIIVEPRQIRRNRSNLLKKISKKLSAELDFYAAIREPSERLESLFFYLKSDISSHEPTHKAYKADSFEQFIINEASEETGSWFSSQICWPNSISDNLFYKEVKVFLKKVKLFKLKNINTMISIAFLQNYGITGDADIYSETFDCFNLSNKNLENCYLEKNNSKMSEDAKLKLKKITKYDLEIFNAAF